MKLNSGLEGKGTQISDLGITMANSVFLMFQDKLFFYHTSIYGGDCKYDRFLLLSMDFFSLLTHRFIFLRADFHFYVFLLKIESAILNAESNTFLLFS